MEDSRTGDMVSLYTKRERAVQTLDQIRGLLEKADHRRALEKGNRRHWDDVLNHLEHSLDEARFKLEQCDAAILQAEKLMSPNDVARAKAIASGEPVESLPAAPPTLSSHPEEAMKQVMSMSIEELRGLNMEQVALLHSQLPEVTLDSQDDAKPMKARLELANQLRAVVPKTTPVSKLMEKRKQLMLRRCLHKASANRFSDITREEKMLLQSTCDMLKHKVEGSQEDARLRQLVEVVMRKLSMT